MYSEAILPTLLNYHEEIKTDSILKLLIDQISDKANLEKPTLQRFKVGLITLTFCNFTSCDLRIDHMRRVFINNLPFAQYTEDDCHIVIYQLQKKYPKWERELLIEKDDDSETILKFRIKRSKDGHRGLVAHSAIQISNGESMS